MAGADRVDSDVRERQQGLGAAAVRDGPGQRDHVGPERGPEHDPTVLGARPEAVAQEVGEGGPGGGGGGSGAGGGSVNGATPGGGPTGVAPETSISLLTPSLRTRRSM